MPIDLRVSKRLVAIIIVVGFFVGFGSGLVENTPDFASIPQNTYYGFPLVWRAVNTTTGEKYTYAFELFADCLFGIVLASIIVATTLATEKWLAKKNKRIRK
jgi:hypothetical protein